MAVEEGLNLADCVREPLLVLPVDCEGEVSLESDAVAEALGEMRADREAVLDSPDVKEPEELEELVIDDEIVGNVDSVEDFDRAPDKEPLDVAAAELDPVPLEDTVNAADDEGLDE